MLLEAFLDMANGSRWYDAHLVLASIVQTSHASSIYMELDTVLKPLLFIPIVPPYSERRNSI